MSIQVGDTLPPITLKRLGPDGIEDFDLPAYVAERTVVIFAVPGAFTPTCAEQHLPSYVTHADDIKAKGVDEIICLAVNDPFVMNHWGQQAGAEGRVTMVSDGNIDFTRAIGMQFDGTGVGLGVRSKRYVMTVKDGTVQDLQVEESPGDLEISTAQACLLRL